MDGHIQPLRGTEPASGFFMPAINNARTWANSDAILPCCVPIIAGHLTRTEIYVSLLQRLHRFFASDPPAEVSPANVIPPATPPVTGPLFNGEAIPAYPDRGVAVPAASPLLLCQSQQALIDRLHQASSFSHEDFNALIRPAILNYAAYAHLLPASDSHHHCGQGGLFRHGLEVALHASIACEAKIFAFDHWASQRDKLVPRWRMCAILGGMIHDMGKPIIDVGAVDASGDLVWNPHAGSVWSWIREHNLPYYYIHWREGARHKRHEAFNALAIDRIIPSETIRWITQHGGQEALDALIMCLSGTVDPRNPLASIIKSADAKSVAKDIQDSRTRLAASGMGGQRNLAVRLVRAMHDLIEAGTWEVNRLGNPIWVTTEGVFGIYPNIISEAIDALRSAGDASLARDSAAVLQSLADWGFVHPNVSPNGQSFNTWSVRIYSQDRGKPVEFDAHVVRFSKEEIIPNTMLPKDPCRASILGRDGQPVTQGGIVSPSISAPTLPPPPPAVEESSASPESPESPAPVETKATAPTKRAKQKAPLRSREVVVESGMGHALLSGDGGIDTLMLDTHVDHERLLFDDDESDQDNSEETDDGGDSAPLRDKGSEEDVRDQMMREAVQTMNAKWPPQSPQEALAWFRSQGHEGKLLEAIASRVTKGTLKEGVDVFDINDRVHLVYPAAFQGLGMADEEIRAALEAKGWTERDASTPNRSTVALQVDTRRLSAVRVNDNISQAMRLLLPARSGAALKSAPSTRVMPFGHYIDEHAAARFTSNLAIQASPTDAPLVRPGFHAFLLDELRETEPDRPLVDLTEEQLKDLILKFVRTHKRLSRHNIVTWLTCEPNPILLASKRGQGVVDGMSFNPAYLLETDVATASAMEPA